jgi:hypothetical protein
LIESLPATIPVVDLEKTGEEYDPKKLAVYQALYDGGSAIEPVKTQLLVMRELERSGSDAGFLQYQERLCKAPYVRYISGFIDWLVAAVFYREPQIVAPKGSEDFYKLLQDDADGKGTPLASLLRETVLECLLHRRGYLAVEFPTDTVRASDEGSKRATLRLVRASEVEDWQEDERGCLEWLRWHGSENVRPDNGSWKLPDRERHNWAFIDCNGMKVFSLDKKVQGTWIGKDAALSRTTVYDGMPIFPVNYRSGQWIMETCFDVVRALFNRDASIEYLCDKFAFQILVLKLNRQATDDIVIPDLGAFKLQLGEDAGFISPSPAVFDPLFKSAEKLRRDLLNSVHASAQNAAAIPQAGRLSGEAVEKMQDPLHTLLYSFAWPVIEAANRALEMIARVRGEDEAAYIIGADEYAATMDDMESEVMTNGTVGKTEEKPAAGNERDAGGDTGASVAGSKD